MSSFTHSELCDIGERYLRNRCNCRVTAKEPYNSSGEIPDVIGFKSGYSYLIEAKTSRSDFFADKKKSFRKHPNQGMGTFRYFICETGLISVEELPPRWGLIYVSPKGRCRLKYGNKGNQYLKKFRFENNIEAEYTVMLALLTKVVCNGWVTDGNWKYINEE